MRSAVLFAAALLLAPCQDGWAQAGHRAREKQGKAKPPAKRAPASGKRDELSGKLRYWKTLSAIERRKLRERYEHYRKLDEAERRRLRTREQSFLERWKLIREHIRIRNPERLKTIEALPVGERWRKIHAIVREWLERDEKVLRRLISREKLNQLDRLPPPQRAAEIQKELGKQLLKRSRRLVERLQRSGRLDAKQARTLLALPPPRLHARLQAIRKQMILERLDKRRDPGGQRIPADVIKRLRGLPPELFLRHYPRIREHFSHSRKGPPDKPAKKRPPRTGPRGKSRPAQGVKKRDTAGSRL